MACSKCGSTNQEQRSGFSKKNNKPWKGLKCLDCDNMDFLRDKATPKPQTTEFPPTNPPKKGNGEVMTKADWAEKNAGIASLALCKVVAVAGGYAKDITDTDHDIIFERVYNDYVNFRNRELPTKEEIGF